MIYCQSCLTPNREDTDVCRKCGTKLLLLGSNQRWEEPELPRVSMDDHFLERISNLEETVNHILENLTRLAESMEAIDRNAFITRSGLASLVETLKESRLLREELLYQRWETTIAEQMEEARYRDRFTQLKGRFIALYRGDAKKRSSFLALIEEADFLIYADRFQEGITPLAQALKCDLRNYELAYYLAEIHQQQGRTDEARQFLVMALEANSEHSDSLLMLGLIAYGDNDSETAIRLLTNCIEVNPQNKAALVSLAGVLCGEHHYSQARPLLEQAMELGPEAQTCFLLGLCARDEGKQKLAIDCFKQAIDLDPEHEEAVFTLGMTYLERGWTRKAEECFSQAMDLNPSNIEYQEASGQWVNPALAGEPPAMEVESLQLMAFAEELFQAGKPKQALPHFRRLLRKYPNEPVVLAGYSLVNFSLRKYEETLKASRKLLAIQTASEAIRIVAYTLHMESLRALSRYEEVVDLMEEMAREMSSGPGHAIASYGLALTKADLGQDLRQAERLAKEAVETGLPEFRHNAMDALSWVHFKQGRYEEALELSEAALSMHESVNHLYHYGMILLALNLREEAFKVFERTVKLRNRTSVDNYLLSAIHDMDTHDS